MSQASKQQENHVRALLNKSFSYDIYEEIDKLVPALNIRNMSIQDIFDKLMELSKHS